MTQLTEHFTLEELLVSEAATEHGFTEQFEPNQDVIDNLKSLCENVLEPLRAAISEHQGVDTPIHVTSGYRCARVNGVVPGAAAHSQHQTGQAADTHVDCMNIEDWYQFIKKTGIKFDQLIQEHNLWAHVSYDPALMRQMKLYATGTIANPIYTPDNN